MADPRPIGVFDSGVGGLTVARALLDLLPDERIIYFGDTARGPYGPRTLNEVRGFVNELVGWLVDADAKAIVAACNTATAGDLLADRPGDPHRFVASGDPDVLRALAVRFLGPRLAAVDVEHPWYELASP